MKRPDKLVQLRKLQRTAAAQRLQAQSSDLQRLQQARQRLLASTREELSRAVAEGATCSIQRLERLELARRAAARAEEETSEAVEDARRDVVASGIALRQVEWLRDRLEQTRRAEDRQREQRGNDEAGARRKPGSELGLLLLLLVVGLGGCSSTTKAKAAPRRDAALEARAGARDGKVGDAKSDAAVGAALPSDARIDADRLPPASMSSARRAKPTMRPLGAAEARVLGKLRARAGALQRAEAGFAAKQRELAQIEGRAKALLSALETLQTQFKRSVPGAAGKAAPGETTAGQGAAAGAASRSTMSTRKTSALAAASPLVKVVQEMKPRAAGELLSAMKPQAAAAVLLALPRARAASLLGRLTEEAMGPVGDAMAEQQRLRTAASGPAGPTSRPAKRRRKVARRRKNGDRKARAPRVRTARKAGGGQP